MRRWLIRAGVAVLVLGVVFAVWQLVTRPELNDNESSPETTVEEDDESGPAPTEEEIEVLVAQFESQDKGVFLEAWVSDLEAIFEEEVIREQLMVPEGAAVTASDPLWPDDNGGWTIDITIEVPGHEPITRTMVLDHFEGRWRILREAV